MTADLHLSHEQLCSLTGYSQPARQCAWLKSRGWVFEPPAKRGDGPKVAIAYHDARMSGAAPAPNARRRPNLDWMLQS